jgi:threonine/homoserine/homoserine lactone efflux protein
LAVYLVFGLTFGFAAAIQPGPFQTFLISRSLNNGWRSTLPAAFAPLLSDIPIVLLVLLLLSRVPPWMQNFLYLAGGLFLLYLAYGAFRSFRQFKGYQTITAESGRQNLFKAAFVNLLNPNPYLEWSLVMGPLLLKGWRETPGNGVALVGGFYLAIIVICVGIILLFASIRRLGVKVSRALIGVSAIALAGFGLYQLWLGASGLWFS